MEYLDERFPHPPLMPVDPVTRAQFRLALFRIERDWYALAEEIDVGGDRKPLARAVKALEESILSSVEIFSAKKFFLSDEFSLVDCTIAPILWRLPLFDIKLPPQARPIQRYMDEVFSRPSFQRQPHRVRAGDTAVAALRTKQRPYLIRAMHDWMVDNGLTPHLVVDASA